MDSSCCNAAADELTEVLDEYFKCLKFILAKTNVIQKSKCRFGLRSNTGSLRKIILCLSKDFSQTSAAVVCERRSAETMTSICTLFR